MHIPRTHCLEDITDNTDKVPQNHSASKSIQLHRFPHSPAVHPSPLQDNNTIHREIMEKLKHDSRSNPQPNSREMSVSPIQRSNSLGSHEQLLATRFEADRRRVLADAAAFQAAALKQLKFPNGGVYGGLPAPAADILHSSRDGMLPFGGRESHMDFMTRMSSYEQTNGQPSHSTGNSSGRSSHSPPSDGSEEIDAIGDDLSPPGSGQWTYEEQFKQLYEMGTEPERKQFLDDLFAFMQKKGSPVNRIPIMAKQTLDIYQLFKLVVAKGGLVEVINKKLWREITKGLNLPSSITSAAFTLRTQYMKYLYPYECEKHNFSSPAELQAAIDGNRREGRRPGYGYDLPPGGLPMGFYGAGQSINNTSFFNPSMLSNPMMNMLTSPLGPNLMGVNGGLPPHIPTPRLPNPAIQASHSLPGEKDENHISPRAAGIINTISPRESAFMPTRSALHDSDSLNRGYGSEAKRMRRDDSPTRSTNEHSRRDSGQTELSDPLSEPSVTSEQSNSSQQSKTPPQTTSPSISSTNIKITNQKDSQSGENQLVITMDLNGTMYQGVLFAQPRPNAEQ